MTIIPKPVQKPLRRLEIIFGLLCLGIGSWSLLRLGLWLPAALQAQSASWGEALWLLAQALYLLGFGGELLRRGYVSLILWTIALAALLSIPVTIRAFI